MRATRGATTTRKTLLRAMHLDDSRQFSSVLQSEGWPMDSEESDHELLVHAIKYNHRRIAHLLLDKGARVSRQVARKLSTPLHLAAAKKTAGWANVVARLLARGACVAQLNGKNQTALHLAFNARAPDEVVDMLLQAHLRKSSLDVFNKDRLGFVHIACTRPHLDVVRELIDAESVLVNCQVSLKSDTIHPGYTPLHFAVEHGRLEIAEFLLRHGADLYRQNVNGSTALHLALEFRNIEMVDLLLSYDKLKLNRVNNCGLSHFMAACAGSNESLVPSYLHSQSASSSSALIASQVHSRKHYPQSSYTPLHFAAEFGRLRTVELLLSRGADCCALALDDLTPHVLAHQATHDRIARLLDQRCRIYQWSTEAPKLSAARYNPIFDQDEQGNIVINFERNVHGSSTGCFDFCSSDSDNSSDDESVRCADDMARLSHEDLVSYFTNDNLCDCSTDRLCDLENVGDDILRSLDGHEAKKVDSLAASDSADFNLDRLSSQDLEILKMTCNDAKDLETFSYSDCFPVQTQSLSAMPFSAPVSDFSPSNASAPAFVSDASYFDAMDSSPLNLVKVSAPSSQQDFVQVPEKYSISWSSFSGDLLDLTVKSHTSNSGASRSGSFVGSYFTDSGVNDSYQSNFAQNGLYQASFSSSLAPQSEEEIDYSGFFSAPSSTPIDVNNNQFVNGSNNVYCSTSFVNDF